MQYLLLSHSIIHIVILFAVARGLLFRPVHQNMIIHCFGRSRSDCSQATERALLTVGVTMPSYLPKVLRVQILDPAIRQDKERSAIMQDKERSTIRQDKEQSAIRQDKERSTIGQDSGQSTISQDKE